MFLNLLFLLVIFQCCAGAIHHLNDTEYDRMPPLYALDKYDACLRNEGAVYCTAKLQLFADPPNDLYNLIKDYSAFTQKHYNHTIIEKGVCVTKRCQHFMKNKDLGKEEDLRGVLEACINNTIWNDYGLQSTLFEKYFCDKHNESTEKDIYDWIVLLVILSLITLNVVGSLYDVIIRRQNHEKNHSYGIKYYLLCFSIPQNWNRLVFSEPEDPRLRRLKPLHGVRCIVMYLFIVGHVFFTYHGYTEAPHQFEKYYENRFYKMLFNGMSLVQILFVVSGFLMAYYLLIETEKRPITWKMVPNIILMRICRLTPANLVYVLLSATWLRHASSGPVWKNFVVDKTSGDCRRYWWSHIIFINNYIPDDVYCVVQNWQLAADMQLFILGLCIFVATKTRFRAIALIALGVLGMASMGIHIWWQELDAYMLLTPEIYRNFERKNFMVHKFTHVNLPGFIMGMLTGLLVYEWQKRNIDISKYKKVLSPLCHLVIPGYAYIFYTGSIFYEYSGLAPLGLRLAYGMALRPVIALLTVYSIVALTFNFSDFYNKVGSWDGWVIPSRLSYSVSLIHTSIIIYLFGSRKELVQHSSFDLLISHLGVAALSFLIAIPYSLMIEAPFNRLIKAIVTKNAQQVKKET